ncbi:uncharacterized protein Dvar_68570 [Desulfosarcina variabilis str. Montpellier]|uniref:hypothetical protein n=1 Tax=Desulfosarcina variabilis TaxID=2300 RepID=UPI003AFA335F
MMNFPLDLNFKKCIKECDLVETELRSCLSPMEIKVLRAEMKSLGRDEWLLWSCTHAASIDEFLAEPPSIRRRQPHWKMDEVRQRFLLAAIQRVRQARRMLLHIDRHCLFPWAGGSGRDAAVRAAQALDDVENYPEPYWPFEGPDPFEGAGESARSVENHQG